MILNFPTRFTASGREVGGEVDSRKLSLAGMSRLLLGETIEYASREELQIIVSERINSILEKLCDEFYGAEKKDQRDFSESLEAIILLVKNNLYNVIEGLNGEKNNLQTLAGLIPFDYNLEESGVKKNGLFGTNLRILTASCFRNEKLSGLVNDLSECLQIQAGKLSFSHMVKRFHYELSRFASDSVHPFEKDDMYQEGCIVLWNCVNKYSGQNFISFRQYFLRSLRNKTIDMLRSTRTNKRQMTLRTTTLSAESFNESQANREVANRYMYGYYEWLHAESNNGSTFFVAPSSVGEYFPENGKSITETQINKTVQKLFDSTLEELFLYIKTQIPEEHFKTLKEFHPTRQMGMIFLRFLFGNPQEGIDLDMMQQRFLQTYLKGHIIFDGEKYCFQNLGDLQETFLMMCREIIEKDPMIQLAFGIKGRKSEDNNKDNEVPF